MPPRADAIDQIDKDVANARYERDNPGEIERMGYRTTRDDFDGELQDVLLLPKNKAGEWDVTLRRRTGARTNEVHDDGSRVVRAGQFQAKFNRLAQDALGSARACLSNPEHQQPASGPMQCDWRDAEPDADEEEEEYPPDSGDDDDDDGLKFVGSTLFASSAASSSAAAAAPKAKPKAKPETKAKAAPQPETKRGVWPASSLRPSKPQPPAHIGSAVPSAGQPKCTAGGQAERGRATVASKMAGKTAGEILNPLGLELIQTMFAAIVSSLGEAPFSTALIGKHLEAFPSKCLDVKKAAANVLAKVVLLHNKVNKWKEIPDCVASEVKLWKAKVLSLI